jgi:hypothetical protein
MSVVPTPTLVQTTVPTRRRQRWVRLVGLLSVLTLIGLMFTCLFIRMRRCERRLQQLEQ